MDAKHKESANTAHAAPLGVARASVTVESVVSATPTKRKIPLICTQGQLDPKPNLHLHTSEDQKAFLHPWNVRDATARVLEAQCSGDSNVHLRIPSLQSPRFAQSVVVHINFGRRPHKSNKRGAERPPFHGCDEG